MSGPIDRFDRAAKRVLALAQDEAFRQFHRGFIAPEHLLLGLLRDQSVAARVLGSLGLDLVRARQTVEVISGRGEPEQEFAEIVLLPETKKVIELAPEEAKRLGSETVAPEHLLLGLVREPGSAEAALRRLDVSPAAIRLKVLETLGRSGE